MKKSGRTIVVFLALIVVILLSGIAISIYLLSKETQTRKDTEVSLSELRDRNLKVEAAFKEAQQQIDVLKGKNKDADDKINNLMEEIDLERALNEKIKAENKKIKDTLEAEAKAKIETRQKLTAELEAVQAKLAEVQSKASGSEEKLSTLQKKLEDFQKKNGELEQQLKDMEAGRTAHRNEILPAPGQDKVNLDRIVISPDDAREGKVLNVDTETEFLIFDLGSRHGIRQGDVMSVYRGKTYLGDVKVSRIQEEMSAADFVPPFSSRKVRKNDQVVPKR